MSNIKNNYLREWRDFRGLTLEQAAERSQLSVSVLSRLETRKRKYNEEHLVGLAEAYRCEPWELLGKDPESYSGDVYKLMMQIPEKDRSRAIQALRLFIPEMH
ncbi:MAG: helix-turn-helix transcriptional regulator [Epibacterium sp.]|nr:helix-turn-helix transcriptional regulator [Epibacterium sp.]NQX73950.1 helix-turn-helix transcriptional regulator [Epibacterium sp.]